MSTESDSRVLERSQHGLSRKAIQKSALKVLYRLSGSDHLAYLVGGAVRDLLLGRRPKDYDVATDARPQRIRRLFRNSRIIGRRFRLVHVYFRDGIIEVSTFRRPPDPEAQDSGSGDLLITDDNAFGSPRQDAFRRDFTINALFYDISSFSVIDYVGGIDDLEAGVVRVIGDADVRFCEDPVRMMRACEYAGRLGFTLETATQEGVARHATKIERASPARVTEEMNQLLRCGCAAGAMQWMFELGLAAVLVPEVDAAVEAEKSGLGRFSGLFSFFDRQVEGGRQMPEVGMFTALLLPKILVECDDRCDDGDSPKGRAKLRQVAAEVAAPFFRRFGLSKLKAEQSVHAVLGFQRMKQGRWKDHERIRFSHRAYFDDALFLLELYSAATGRGEESLRRWQRVRQARPEISVRRRPDRRRPRRKRRRGASEKS